MIVARMVRFPVAPSPREGSPPAPGPYPNTHCPYINHWPAYDDLICCPIAQMKPVSSREMAVRTSKAVCRVHSNAGSADKASFGHTRRRPETVDRTLRRCRSLPTSGITICPCCPDQHTSHLAVPSLPFAPGMCAAHQPEVGHQLRCIGEARAIAQRRGPLQAG